MIAHEVTILTATDDHADVLVDGEPMCLDRAAVNVAVSWMRDTGELSYVLAGVRFSVGQLTEVAKAMSYREMAGAAR